MVEMSVKPCRIAVFCGLEAHYFSVYCISNTKAFHSGRVRLRGCTHRSSAGSFPCILVAAEQFLGQTSSL